jgi:hypothetical protein
MLALRKHQSPIACLLLAFITAFLTGCGGGSSSTPSTSPSITTTSVPNATTNTAYTASVTATGGTGPFTWSVSSGSLPTGLSLSSSTTNSVTIEGTPTSAQQGAAFTLKVTDSASKSGTKALTMDVSSSVSVTISNKLAGIAPAAAAVQFNASVANDASNQGVTWTLKANNADCSPACGTLSGATNALVIYTPPASIPAAPNNSVTITATAVADTTKSDSNLLSITNSPLSACTQSGNEAVLNGKYAFLVQGQNTLGSGSMLGSFTADGSGNITAGEVDLNGVTHSNVALDTSESSYSVSADNRGCMTLKAGSNTTVVHFALGGITANVATKGRLIQFDDAVGTGLRATGVLRKQDSTAISTNLNGSYAFNFVGSNDAGGRYSIGGATTVSGGLLSNGEVDVDDAGTAGHSTGASGLLSSSLDANGRGSFTLIPTVTTINNYVFYIVSSSEILVASTDALTIAPNVSGEMRLQTGPFTAASLNGVSVIHMAGFNGTTRNAAIGTLTTNGAGSITAVIQSQDGATVNAPDTSSTTYTVAANGRVTLAASDTPVLYLTGANVGFVAANDADVTSGEFEAQTGGPFNAASLSGDYFFGTEAVGSNAANAEVGIATPDGSGNASVMVDVNSSTGIAIDILDSSTYTVNADGMATIAGNSAVLVSPNKVVVLDGGSANSNANVIVLEK